MAYHRQKKKTIKQTKHKRNFMGIAFEVHSRDILSNQQFCKNKAVNGLPHRKKKKKKKQ
jgi:hypothetical protein